LEQRVAAAQTENEASEKKEATKAELYPCPFCGHPKIPVKVDDIPSESALVIGMSKETQLEACPAGRAASMGKP